MKRRLKKGSRVLINRWLSLVLDMPGYKISKLFAGNDYKPESIRKYLLAHGYQEKDHKPD